MPVSVELAARQRPSDMYRATLGALEMFRLVLLRLIVGVVTGAFAVGALFPILMMVPHFVGLGIVIFVFGNAVIWSVTSEELRQAAGRSLVMLGSTLLLMPILSITLGALPIASIADLSIKSNKYAYVFEPVIWQMFATFVAFGAGSIVSVAGLVVMIDGRRGYLHPSRRSGTDPLPDRPSSEILQSTHTKREAPPVQKLQKSAQNDPRKYSSASGISLRQLPDRMPARELRKSEQGSPSSFLKMRSEIAANSGAGLRASGMSGDARPVSYAASRDAVAENFAKATKSGAEQKTAGGMIPLTPITPARWRSAETLSVSAGGDGVVKQKQQEAAQLNPGAQKITSGQCGEVASTRQDTNKVTETPPSETPHADPTKVRESKLSGELPSSPMPDGSNEKAVQGAAESKPVEDIESSLEETESSHASNQPIVLVELPAIEVVSCAEDDKSEKPAETGGKSAGTLMDRERRRLIAKQIADLANSVRRPETTEKEAIRVPGSQIL